MFENNISHLWNIIGCESSLVSGGDGFNTLWLTYIRNDVILLKRWRHYKVPHISLSFRDQCSCYFHGSPLLPNTCPGGRGGEIGSITSLHVVKSGRNTRKQFKNRHHSLFALTTRDDTLVLSLIRSCHSSRYYRLQWIRINSIFKIL